MLASTILLMGCGLLETADSVGADKMREEERVRQEEQAELDRYSQADADQVLASGQVLSVRVHWGTDTEATSCLVRIENPRNGWYDEIEDSTAGESLGSSGPGFADFPFGAENFNRQTNQEYYPEPEDIAGAYDLSIQLSTGESEHMKVYWDDEGKRFEPGLLNVPF